MNRAKIDENILKILDTGLFSVSEILRELLKNRVVISLRTLYRYLDFLLITQQIFYIEKPEKTANKKPSKFYTANKKFIK